MIVLPDVTVVVPTVGRPVLARTLSALANGSARPAAVIVVDQSGGSAATAMRAAADAGLDGGLLIPSTGRGAAEARNRGFAHASTRYVAAIDDDCLPAVDWLERLHCHLRAHPDEVITGQVRGEGGAAAPSLITSTAEVRYTQPLRDRDPLYTGNIGVAQAVFWRVGAFDEHPALWPAAEDNEWAYRALRAGVAIRYVPDAVVSHLDWRSASALADVARRYARGQGGFYGRHLRRGDPFVAGRLARDVARGAWWLVRGAVMGDAQLCARGRAQVTALPAGVIAGAARPHRRDHSRGR